MNWLIDWRCSVAIQDLISNLEKAAEGGRAFDVEIGLLMGWRRKVEHVKTDEHGEPERRIFWIVPSGKDPGTVPHYSTSLDAALLLARTVSPGHSGGVSWVDGKGTAIINDGPYCVAATPALALCVAALRAKLAEDSNAVELRS